VRAFEEMGARPYVARATREWGHALIAGGRINEGRAKLTESRDELAELGIKREADELTAELSA
jgi:hypothetical protein